MVLPVLPGPDPPLLKHPLTAAEQLQGPGHHHLAWQMPRWLQRCAQLTAQKTDELAGRRAGCILRTCTHCLNIPSLSPHVEETFNSGFSVPASLTKQAEDR